MINLLVSACLLGINCKYDGNNNLNEKVTSLRFFCNLIPVCPEQLGGLTTPRLPSELMENRAINSKGDDVSKIYFKGADETLKIAKMFNCKYAVLKERSPSCGTKSIYDGSFTHTLKDGEGITAKILEDNGIHTFSEDNIEDLISLIKCQKNG